MEEIEIKIVRLNTGEDIMGAVLMDDRHRYVSIENPMRIVLKRLSDKGQTMLLMAPWLPVELIMDNFATIDYTNIITIVDPKPSFSEYYENTVLQYSDRLQKDLMAETEDMEFDNDEFEIEEDDTQSILEAAAEAKKRTIH